MPNILIDFKILSELIIVPFHGGWTLSSTLKSPRSLVWNHLSGVSRQV
jgi:hypothetical protein